MAILDPFLFGTGIIAIVSMVVFYDLWRIWSSQRQVPKLGLLENGGYAWASGSETELGRDIPGLMAIAAMMVLPWFFAEQSGTPHWQVITFDVLLALHALGMILPKRQAITATHLHVDGHSIPWSALKPAKRQKAARIVLHRKGWWFFAPLALAGSPADLSIASSRIAAILLAEEE
ncbi:MAG: hypothetical protein QGH90_03205 [Candidatus Poseidoniaceae archaeon]|jgi:hypothetical protein|nr:hypothetical protein [Candidatus Poseidoniaceae archaeon]MDP7000888.1 hypothetical protein [Candidatus Poseidoniaceae archaeon]